jgi:hypothetical protein
MLIFANLCIIFTARIQYKNKNREKFLSYYHDCAMYNQLQQYETCRFKRGKQYSFKKAIVHRIYK